MVNMMSGQLRGESGTLLLEPNEVVKYAREYDLRCSGKSEELVELELRTWFEDHDYLDRPHFLQLCMWKSPRPKRHYEANSDSRIVAITHDAITASDERHIVECLQSQYGGLSGVSYPVASVILHYSHPERYMIMDWRAIESLGWRVPNTYTFDFWSRYTAEVKGVARTLNVSLRTLDKALWEYSKQQSAKTVR